MSRCAAGIRAAGLAGDDSAVPCMRPALDSWPTPPPAHPLPGAARRHGARRLQRPPQAVPGARQGVPCASDALIQGRFCLAAHTGRPEDVLAVSGMRKHRRNVREQPPLEGPAILGRPMSKVEIRAGGSVREVPCGRLRAGRRAEADPPSVRSSVSEAAERPHRTLSCSGALSGRLCATPALWGRGLAEGSVARDTAYAVESSTCVLVAMAQWGVAAHRRDGVRLERGAGPDT
jgi:hypothetical protein